MTNLEILDQVIILLTGPVSVYLVGADNRNLQKWGFLFAMIGQPFWIHASAVAGQWGILITNILFAFAWLKGFNTYWLIKEEVK